MSDPRTTVVGAAQVSGSEKGGRIAGCALLSYEIVSRLAPVVGTLVSGRATAPIRPG